MRIIYSFIDDMLSYNCKLCNGTCCNLNSIIEFTKEQIYSIKDFNLLKDYSFSNNNITKLMCGKKCWFLYKNRCSLNSFNKPITCQLYPNFLWKLIDNIYICDINPCPEMYLEENNTIKIKELRILINKYIDNFNIPEHLFKKNIYLDKNFDILKRIKIIEEWKTEYFNELLKYRYIKSSKEVLYMSFFPQLIFHPIIFYQNDLKIDYYKNHYLNKYKEYKNISFKNNFYNFFIILKKEFLKEILFNKYFPLNNNLIEKLSTQEKKQYFTYYENKLLLNNIHLFNKFYRDKNTIWKEFSYDNN